MANVKDLLASPATASVQQPPSGVNVTEATNKDPLANIISQAETKKQLDLRTATEASAAKEIAVKKELVIKKGSEADTHYTYSIAYGRHSLEIRPEKGLSYNYHAMCSCQWEGRFLTSDAAEMAAKTHISR